MVTKVKVEINGTAYFLKNISSIRIRAERSQYALPMLAVGIAITIISAAMPFAFGSLGLWTVIWFLFGIGVAAAGWSLRNPTYVLVFDTSAGSVNAYQGDLKVLQEVKEHIETAISLGV